MLYRYVFALLIASFCGVANAGLFGPSNYDDCVLEGIKTAKTDSAVALVVQACANKFPSPPVLPRLKAGKDVKLICTLDADRSQHLEFYVHGSEITLDSGTKGVVTKRTPTELAAKIQGKNNVDYFYTFDFSNGRGESNGKFLLRYGCEEVR